MYKGDLKVTNSKQSLVSGFLTCISEAVLLHSWVCTWLISTSLAVCIRLGGNEELLGRMGSGPFRGVDLVPGAGEESGALGFRIYLGRVVLGTRWACVSDSGKFLRKRVAWAAEEMLRGTFSGEHRAGAAKSHPCGSGSQHASVAFLWPWQWSVSALSGSGATSRMWLLHFWKVTSETEDLNF